VQRKNKAAKMASKPIISKEELNWLFQGALPYL
jgi:hypothetical protein